MVLDLPAVQLEDEPSVVIDQPFVVGAAVVAASAEETPEPLACGLDIVDGEERLWTHAWTVATAAHPEVLVDPTAPKRRSRIAVPAVRDGRAGSVVSAAPGAVVDEPV